MNRLIKKSIKYFINRLGYDITIKRIPKPIDLYADFPAESLKARRFYNIGSGPFWHKYWTNIDYATDHYSASQKMPFVNYDLMAIEPLPIESNIAEIVYSSHTVEHVSDDAVTNMIKEAYRILKPGGCVRIISPDVLLAFKAYKRNDIAFWYLKDFYSKKGTWEKCYKIPLSKASIHQLFLHHFASQLCEIVIDDSISKKYTDSEIIDIFQKYPMEEALNYFTKQCRFDPAHPGKHINWWTHEKLLGLLKEAHFSECYRSGYGQSLFPPLRDTALFDTSHPKTTLYVEAIK